MYYATQQTVGLRAPQARRVQVMLYTSTQKYKMQCISYKKKTCEQFTHSRCETFKKAQRTTNIRNTVKELVAATAIYLYLYNVINNDSNLIFSDVKYYEFVCMSLSLFLFRFID